MIYYPHGINQIYIHGGQYVKQKSNTIKALIVEPGKAPYATNIPAGLESLQKLVGGLIQALYPFDDLIAVIANDEGKLLGLPWNRPLFDEDGNIYDILVGTFLVVGLTEDDFCSLSDDLLQKYTEVFRMGF